MTDDYNRNFERDLEYIKNDVIARQSNRKYCKYSKIAKMVTVTNITKKNYISYWTKLYRDDQNKVNIIIKICEEKFKNGLTDLEDVIELEKQSNISIKEIMRSIKTISNRMYA